MLVGAGRVTATCMMLFSYLCELYDKCYVTCLPDRRLQLVGGGRTFADSNNL